MRDDTTNLSNIQPSLQPPNRVFNPQNDLPTNQISRQPSNQPTDQTSEQSASKTSLNKPTSDKFDDPVHMLTDNQAKILSYLTERTNGIAERKEMCRITGVAYGTTSDALRKLKMLGFITDMKKYHNGRFQGFRFYLDVNLCKRFMQERGWQLSYQPTIQHSFQPSNESINNPAIIYNSSILEDNTTTKQKMMDALENDPDLVYWKNKQLGVGQIMHWISEMKIHPDVMLEELRKFAFKMEIKEVDSPEGYFYKTLKYTGNIPLPKGYKTASQKKIEAEQQILENLRQETKKIKEIRAEKQRLERDLMFQGMMSGKDNELYSECFENLSTYQKERFRDGIQKKTKNFERAMRNSLDRLLESEEKNAGES